MATRKNLKITFDSPVTLILVFFCFLSGILSKSSPELQSFFSCPTCATGQNPFNFKSLADYFKLIFYPLGFSDWNVLSKNLVFILFLCPKVEQVFGKSVLSLILFVSVLFAGVICVCFSNFSMVGTSGIVCLLLILLLYSSIDKKDLPFSYILLALIYFACEIISIFSSNSLVIFCHFAGALVGSLVGILSLNSKR